METAASRGRFPLWQTIFGLRRVTIMVMPPRIGPRNKKLARVFLRAWREHDFPTMSQEQFGQRFHPPVDKGTVSRWENAQPGHLTLGVIAAYAEALGRQPAEMHGPPGQGQSLDAMATGLDKTLRDRAADVIDALRGRRAG